MSKKSSYTLLENKLMLGHPAKRHHLVCWQAYISANWAVGGVCNVFACLLGS